MAIRPVTAADAPTILPLWRAEAPEGLLAEENVREIVASALNSFFMDDDPAQPSCCWVNVNPPEQHVQLVLLLPRGRSMARLRFPFRAAMLDAAERHPEALPWIVFARFRSKVRPRTRRDVFPDGPAPGKVDEGQQAALAWKAGFGATVSQETTGYWRIELPTFGQAIAVVRLWPS